MKLFVLDTNILVSGLFSQLQSGNPARFLQQFLAQDFTLVYSPEIFEEYANVLRRPKFKFSSESIDFILNAVKELGLCEHALPGLSGQPRCSDPDDQKFYDLALSTDAVLVTGNTKHFPKDKRVVTPAEYLAKAILGDFPSKD